MTRTPKTSVRGASKRAANVRAKKAPSAPAARPARRSAKTPAKAAEPFLRFYYPENLRTKTLGVLHDIETAEDETAYRDALASVVGELTDSGMDYYFLRALKLAKAGFITQQSAKLGMTGATSLLGSVIRSVIGRMDKRELLAVCGHIRQLMR